MFVTGIGMASCLGIDAKASCAAARAGLNRMSEIPLPEDIDFDESIDDAVPIMGCQIPTLEGFISIGRLAMAAKYAIDDLANDVGGLDNLKDVPIFINFPSNYYQAIAGRMEGESVPLSQDERLDKDFVKVLSGLSNFKPDPQNVYYDFGGCAGFVRLLQMATELMLEGKTDKAIIGGVDSHIDKELLDTLFELRVLKTSDNSRGFIPGEAASFILVEKTALNLGDKKAIEISGCAGLKSDTHLFSKDPPNGKALSQCILNSVSSLDQQGKEVGLILGNCNGTEYYASDWGHAQVHLNNKIDLSHQIFPIESFGEVGTASGPVFTCTAVRAFERNYSETDTILVWLSSSLGLVGSFYLRAY